MYRIIIALVASSSFASAGIITDVGGTNPSGVIEQTIANNRTARAERNGGGERTFGQTFTATDNFSIDSLYLRTANARNYSILSPATLQLKFFDMNGNPDSGLPDFDNTLLSTFDYDVSALNYGADTWLELTFDSPIILTQDELYGFLVFWDADDPDNTFDVRHTFDAGSTIAGGTMRTTSTYNSGNWLGANPWGGVPVLDSDLTFVLGGSVVPEPSSFVLAAFVLAATFSLRRRQIAKCGPTG